MIKTILLISFLLMKGFCLNGQDLSELYESVITSVVKINTKERIENRAKGFVSTEEGLGSGVLVDTSGLILTAAHVVQTANNIIVEFSNGDQIPASVVSSVPTADVALIKLLWPSENRKAARIGNSDLMKTGHQIMMVGSPLGLDFSMSVGYISGRHVLQTYSNGEKWVEFLQTDASINKGNSGGPMFNLDGELVGIASYILSESGGFEGLGFAASSNVCVSLLLESDSPWSGVDAMIINGAMSRILNVPQESGFLIQRVSNLSPADILGLRGGDYEAEIEGQQIKLGGDIVLSVNGIKVTGDDSIVEITKSMQVHDEVEVEILREGKIMTVKGMIRN